MGRRKGKVCAVVACKNCDGDIRLWKTSVCETHAPLLHQHCPCPSPFSMHRIPQGERNKVIRQCWLDNLQRENFYPDTSARVCSIHFVDGRPTEDNPYPTLHLGTLNVQHIGRTNGTRGTAQSHLDGSLQLGAPSGSRPQHSVTDGHSEEDKAHDSASSEPLHPSRLGPGIITYQRPFRGNKGAAVSRKCLSCGCNCKAIRKMDKGIQAQPIPGQLLSRDVTIRHTPRQSHCSRTDRDDVTAEPVHEAAPSLACDLGQCVDASPEPVHEPNHVTDKSVQVRLLTRHKESQANEKKILSTIATQTEPQAVFSGCRRT
ncbi:hypothetical protein MTO96_042084 [Rhipicephalus appendiculatus]